jgi:hypothetical protein
MALEDKLAVGCFVKIAAGVATGSVAGSYFLMNYAEIDSPWVRWPAYVVAGSAGCAIGIYAGLHIAYRFEDWLKGSKKK